MLTKLKTAIPLPFIIPTLSLSSPTNPLHPSFPHHSSICLLSLSLTLYFRPLLKLETVVPGASCPFRNSFGTRGCFLAFFLLAPHRSNTITSSPILAATAQLQAAFLLQERKKERIYKTNNEQNSSRTIDILRHDCIIHSINLPPRKHRLISYLIWKCLVSVQDEFSLLEDIICPGKRTKI